ncbi:MAG TPA: N-formylglutamate amidohydrolase [Candidatus Saccharibacteria bacterium]|nr:N-formylglutamate amidohydrolase [Candidatus Saccharibacteria bacterium]HMT55878.1 N-formylglutamate amidohydrolase [Candidatus Saccharibacteria bacterium]
MRSFHKQTGLETIKKPTLHLPDNALLLATHGSADLPTDGSYSLSHDFLDPQFGEARQRDYSDFATGLILDHFHPSVTVQPPRYGRIAGDANRAPSTSMTGEPGVVAGKESFRTTNMSGLIPVWEHAPDKSTRALWLDENIRTYFERIGATVLQKLNETTGNILVVDLHDTGDKRLLPDGSAIPLPKRVEKYGRRTFWEAVLSDCEGRTTHPGVMNAAVLATKQVYEKAGIPSNDSEVMVNDPYKGGFVTEYVGAILPHYLQDVWGVSSADAARINAIQIEIPRHRYMKDEQYQIVDPQKISQEAQRVQEIITITANQIR